MEELQEKSLRHETARIEIPRKHSSLIRRNSTVRLATASVCCPFILWPPIGLLFVGFGVVRRGLGHSHLRVESGQARVHVLTRGRVESVQLADERRGLEPV